MKFNLRKFLSEHRLLDGYLGILGCVCHYKLLAGYSYDTIYIVSLSVMIRFFNLRVLRELFHFDVTRHYWNTFYPPVTIKFTILGFDLINTANTGHRKLIESIEARNKEDFVKKEALEQELGQALPLARKWSQYAHMGGFEK